MSQHTSDKKALAASHIQQALDTGVRKELRTTLLRALELATDESPKEITQLHYDRLGASSRLADPNRPGLIMKSGKTGVKRWILRTQVDGGQREIALGHYPAMSVAQAREQWAVMRSQSSQSDARAATTLEQLVDDYAAWASQHLRSWKKNDQLLRKHLLPGRAGITLGELDIDHLNAPISALQGHAPQQARKLRSAISGVLRRARRDGKLPKGFAITPAMLAEVDAAGTRTWHPTTKHLRTFLSASAGMGDLGDALRLIALTGVRLREGLEMRWQEVEGDRWTIPAERMKAGRPHVVMLSDAAVALLEARRGTGSDFVFPSPSDPARALSADHVSRTWRLKREALGLPDQFTLHTLRKALATWVAESGGTRDIRDRLTAHTLATGVDAHYNQAQLNKPAAEWWQKWADHLAAIAGENVVLLEEGLA